MEQIAPFKAQVERGGDMLDLKVKQIPSGI
jgi:hypothetical protein